MKNIVLTPLKYLIAGVLLRRVPARSGLDILRKLLVCPLAHLYNARKLVDVPLLVELITPIGARNPLIDWSLAVVLIKGFGTV